MSQRVRMTTRSRNPLRAVLVWPHAVKWHNVSRLIRIAKKSDPSFRIVGTPVAVGGRILPAARAAVSGRNNAKKLRLRTKRIASGASPISAPHSPAAAASSAAPLAAVTRFLPASSLNMKWWHIHSHWQNGKGFCESFRGRTATLEISWDTILGSGRISTVYAGRVSGTQRQVAIKMVNIKHRMSAGMELGWCVAVANHPDIVTILDVEVIPRGCHHYIGLVFERYHIDVRQLLKKKAVELAGLRYVLRNVVSALTYMHEKGILHADLQPANLLMRPEDFAPATAWSQWLGLPLFGCESGLPLFGGCISPRGCIFKVVVSHLGSARLACPEQRFCKESAPGATPESKVVRLCAPECRSPDLFLGNERYNQAVDMWSLGCVSVELLFRVPLFNPTSYSPSSKKPSGLHYCQVNPHDFLKSHVSFLPPPQRGCLAIPELFAQHAFRLRPRFRRDRLKPLRP